MMFFLFIAACFATETAKTTMKLDADGKFLIQINKDAIDEAILGKCIDADFFKFTLTKKDEKYNFNIFMTEGCTGNALYSHELTKVTEAIEKLPVFQEGIPLNFDGQEVEITIAHPLGCLLEMLPDFNADINGGLNLEFVKTQFGVSVHEYTESTGKCEGKNAIKQILGNVGETLNELENNIKIKIDDVKLNLPENLKFLENFQDKNNMFEELANTVYQYAQNEIATLLENKDKIYEYLEDGKMRVYEKVDGQMKYVKECIQSTSEKILNIVKDGAKDIYITGDCDNGYQFGWNGGEFQQVKISGSSDCGKGLTGLNFNINLKTEVELAFTKDSASMTIDGKTYTFNKETFEKKIEDAKEKTVAIVESFGSMLEFDLGKCYEISISNMVKYFSDMIADTLPAGFNLAGIVTDTLEQIDEFISKLPELVQEFIPKYSYSIGSMELTLGEFNKKFATYNFYKNENCGEKPIFEFIVGEIDEEKTLELIESGFALTKYLNQTACEAKKGIEGVVKEHVQMEVCVNGYKYVLENDQLKKVACTPETKQLKKAEGDVVVFPCGTCVECAKKAGFIQEGEYAYVDCGAKPIFMIFMIFLFFILF